MANLIEQMQEEINRLKALGREREEHIDRQRTAINELTAELEEVRRSKEAAEATRNLYAARVEEWQNSFYGMYGQTNDGFPKVKPEDMDELLRRKRVAKVLATYDKWVTLSRTMLDRDSDYDWEAHAIDGLAVLKNLVLALHEPHRVPMKLRFDLS